MVNFLRLTLFILIFFLAAGSVTAQKNRGYIMGFGVKAGKFSSGATGKFFMGSSNALAFEANLTVKKNFGTGMGTFFLEWQKPFFNRLLQIPLDYMVGLGAHTAVYKAGYYKIRDGNKDAYYDTGISMGLDAKVGLEYTWTIAPLTTSIEACPMIDIINRGPEVLEIAVTLRYIIGSTPGQGRKFGGRHR